MSTFCVRRTSSKWISSLKLIMKTEDLVNTLILDFRRKEFKSLKEGEFFVFLSHDKTNSENVAIVGGAFTSHILKK